MGTTTAIARAAGPFRDYGLVGTAGGLSRSTPRHADDTTTRPSRSGPMRQSNARDSTQSQTTCYGRRGKGRVFINPSIEAVFLSDNQRIDVWRLEDSNDDSFFLRNGIL